MAGGMRKYASAVLLTVTLCAGPISAQDTTAPATIEDAHADYIKDRGLQHDRPVAEPEERPEPRERSESRGQSDWAFFRWLRGLFSGASVGLRGLLYVGLGLIVAIILYMLVRQFSDFRLGLGKALKVKTDEEDDVLVDLRPEEKVALTLLEEADELAKQGRYAEAVHLLLFRSIEDIQSRRKRSVPKSMTAREIAGLNGLTDQVRGALSPIIQIVERSFFGGRPVDEAGWREARASYETFAFGEAWT